MSIPCAVAKSARHIASSLSQPKADTKAETKADIKSDIKAEFDMGYAGGVPVGHRNPRLPATQPVKPSVDARQADERLKKAWTLVGLAGAPDQRERAVTHYLACLACDLPLLSGSQQDLHAAQAGKALDRLASDAARGRALNRALVETGRHGVDDAQRTCRALSRASKGHLPTPLMMELAFDVASGLRPSHQRVLMNEIMRSQLEHVDETHAERSWGLPIGAALGEQIDLYRDFFAAFDGCRWVREEDPCALLSWMHEVLTITHLHEQGMTGLTRLAVESIAATTDGPFAEPLMDALMRAAIGSGAVAPALRELIRPPNFTNARTLALEAAVQVLQGTDELSARDLQAIMEPLAERYLAGNPDGVLMVRSIACALGIPKANALASPMLVQRMFEAAGPYSVRTKQHLEVGINLAVDPLRLLHMAGLDEDEQFLHLRALHRAPGLTVAERVRLLEGYCVQAPPALRERLLLDALAVWEGGNAQELLLRALAALMPWAVDTSQRRPADDKGTPAAQDERPGAPHEEDAERLHMGLKPSLKERALMLIDAVARVNKGAGAPPARLINDVTDGLDTEAALQLAASQAEHQERRQQLLTASTLVMHWQAARGPTGPARQRPEPVAGGLVSDQAQASHTTTRSPSPPQDGKTSRSTKTQPEAQHRQAQRQALAYQVITAAKLPDPALRAQRLLSLFQDAGQPFDAPMFNAARDALAAHPGELSPPRAAKNAAPGAHVVLAPQHRGFTGRMVALYEYFLACLPSGERHSFLKSQLAWAERMNASAAGQPLAGQLGSVIVHLRDWLGLTTDAQAAAQDVD